jgi:hypothetical protein
MQTCSMVASEDRLDFLLAEQLKAFLNRSYRRPTPFYQEKLLSFIIFFIFQLASSLLIFPQTFPPKHMSSFSVLPTKIPSQAWIDLAQMTQLKIFLTLVFQGNKV